MKTLGFWCWPHAQEGRMAQRVALEESRLGIPLIYGSVAWHIQEKGQQRIDSDPEIGGIFHMNPLQSSHPIFLKAPYFFWTFLNYLFFSQANMPSKIWVSTFQQKWPKQFPGCDPRHVDRLPHSLSRSQQLGALAGKRNCPGHRFRDHGLGDSLDLCDVAKPLWVWGKNNISWKASRCYMMLYCTVISLVTINFG